MRDDDQDMVHKPTDDDSFNLEVGMISEESIKNILQRLNVYMFDDLLDVVTTASSSPASRDSIAKLLVHDKYHVYYNIWQMSLDNLYNKYLPSTEYQPIKYIEITPYTLYCATLQTTEADTKKLINNIISVIGISEKEFLSDIDKKLQEINFDLSPLNILPANLTPSTTLDKAALLAKLMNFPPLHDLYHFYQLYYNHTQKNFEMLGSVFSNKAYVSEFRATACLGASFFHFSQKTFEKFDLHKIKDIDYFKSEVETIDDILKKADEQIKINKPIICSSCGSPHLIEALPKEATLYLMCIHKDTLARKLGFYYFEDFQKQQIENMSEYFRSFFTTINNVDDPKCLILVEGDSENTSLPILGFKARKLLKPSGVKVHNCGSKEQVLIDFQKYKREMPHLKVIVLLDSDAQKERDTITRMIKDKKHKYELFFINEGTFEDLFDINLSVDILNKMYPDGGTIELSDFDKNKDFLHNIKKILYKKKKATFDKVRFAKDISFKLTKETIPPLLLELIIKSQQFAEAD